MKYICSIWCALLFLVYWIFCHILNVYLSASCTSYSRSSFFLLFKVHLFVDATFKIVPQPFYQCFIIVVFDARSSHIHTMCRDTSDWKNKWVILANNWLYSTLDSIDPAYAGVDFKRAFISQVASHFPDANLISFLFHFKQALHRNMIKLAFLKQKSSSKCTRVPLTR